MRLLNIIKCVNCMEALVQHPTTTSSDLHLINLRDNGGLIYPSKDVVAVCKAAERVFRFYNRNQPSSIPHLLSTMECRTAHEMIGSGAFLSTEHARDALTGEAGHGIILMPLVARHYLQVRAYDLGKKQQNSWKEIKEDGCSPSSSCSRDGNYLNHVVSVVVEILELRIETYFFLEMTPCQNNLTRKFVIP